YNKRQDDFSTVRLYNDFLEQVEEIIFNLVNEIDVKATEERVERYKKENQENIVKNLHKATLEQQAVQSYLELEHQRRIKSREEYESQLEAEIQAKETEKEAILNELQTSNRSASEILRHHSKHPPVPPPLFTTNAITTSFHALDPLSMHVIDPFDTLYHDDTIESCFDMRDDYYDPYMSSFKDNKVCIAGGFDVSVTYLKSIQAAFRGLFVPPMSENKS
ncbi:CDK-activating kinase assembly factor MAT1, partial [Coelomomyces lativittatus]